MRKPFFAPLLCGLILFAAPMVAAAAVNPPAAIILTKTVGTDPGCATTKEISVAAGTMVNYCYAVQNVGTLTLLTHTLDDDVLGTIFGPDAMAVLKPGQVLTKTASSVINQTTVNKATWTAEPVEMVITYVAVDGVEPAVDMDMATVNVSETGTGACSDGIDNDLNGATDCADIGCVGEPFCNAPAPLLGGYGMVLAAIVLLAVGSISLVLRRKA